MNRKLDDIELEEMEQFHIDQTTLTIKTKTENISYSYPNSLELLRRIGYLLHRYEVEYSRKEKNQNIDNSAKENDHHTKINRNKNVILGLVFLFFLCGPTISLVLPSVYWYIVTLIIIINLKLNYDNIKETTIIEEEKRIKLESQKQRELQINKEFNSLKEISLAYLKKITKTTIQFDVDEKHYIDVIEKGFQKRIGTYPQQ